jgi:hypothetical protein
MLISYVFERLVLRLCKDIWIQKGTHTSIVSQCVHQGQENALKLNFIIKLGSAIHDSLRLGFQNAQIDVVFWDKMAPAPGASVPL